MKLNIVITGYSGFLGRHLVKKLNNHNLYKIDSSVCDLTHQKDTHDYFSAIKHIDLIFHLAVKTKAGEYCLSHQGEQWVNNQLINTNVLNSWHKFHPNAKMIAFGTSCGYDKDSKNRSENSYLYGLPEESLFTYAMSKRMLLAGLKALSAQYDMKWLYFIPSTLYGPEFDEKDSHFIFDLIKKIVKGRYNNQEVELWGNGQQKRELIYVDDAINIILNGLKYNNEIFNIGCGKENSIRDFAQIICDYIGYDFQKIKFNTFKYTGPIGNSLDISKIKKYDLFHGFIPVETGIKNVIDYYLKFKKLI